MGSHDCHCAVYITRQPVGDGKVVAVNEASTNHPFTNWRSEMRGKWNSGKPALSLTLVPKVFSVDLFWVINVTMEHVKSVSCHWSEWWNTWDEICCCRSAVVTDNSEVEADCASAWYPVSNHLWLQFGWRGGYGSCWCWCTESIFMCSPGH